MKFQSVPRQGGGGELLGMQGGRVEASEGSELWGRARGRRRRKMCQHKIERSVVEMRADLFTIDKGPTFGTCIV